MVYRGAKRWEIKFENHQSFLAADCGFARELHYVLKRAYRPFHVLEVQVALFVPAGTAAVSVDATGLGSGQSVGPGNHAANGMRLTPEQYKPARALLEEKLQTARANGDPTAAERVEECLERLERWHLSVQYSEAYRAKQCMDRLRRARSRFEARIRKERQSGGLAFLAHLADCLTLANNSIHYHPPPGYIWDN